MLDFFKSVRWSLLFIGLVTIAIGVAMVMYPETATDTIVKILGGMMAAFAVISILGYLFDRARGLTSFTSLLVGVLMLIMGAFLYLKPEVFEEFLGYIFAALVSIQGLNLMVEGISSKKYKTSHWGQTILMGLICIGLAVIIYFNPFGTFKALMIITGSALILAGLMNLFVSGRIGMAAHNFNVAVKAVEKELSEEADIKVLPSEEVVETPLTEEVVETPIVEEVIEETVPDEQFVEDSKSDGNTLSDKLKDIKLIFSDKEDRDIQE